MHGIFYIDHNGNQPVLEYLRELASSDSKDSGIKLNKIRDYIQILRLYGKQAWEPYVKQLQEEVVWVKTFKRSASVCSLGE